MIVAIDFHEKILEFMRRTGGRSTYNDLRTQFADMDDQLPFAIGHLVGEKRLTLESTTPNDWNETKVMLSDTENARSGHREGRAYEPPLRSPNQQDEDARRARGEEIVRDIHKTRNHSAGPQQPGDQEKVKREGDKAQAEGKTHPKSETA